VAIARASTPSKAIAEIHHAESGNVKNGFSRVAASAYNSRFFVTSGSPTAADRPAPALTRATAQMAGLARPVACVFRAAWRKFVATLEKRMGVAALCLFLMLVVATVWWLYSRWSELRDAEASREQSAALFVLAARSQASAKMPLVTPESASGFYPTLPEGS
jgi:hypothetical protein